MINCQSIPRNRVFSPRSHFTTVSFSCLPPFRLPSLVTLSLPDLSGTLWVSPVTASFICSYSSVSFTILAPSLSLCPPETSPRGGALPARPKGKERKGAEREPENRERGDEGGTGGQRAEGGGEGRKRRRGERKSSDGRKRGGERGREEEEFSWNLSNQDPGPLCLLMIMINDSQSQLSLPLFLFAPPQTVTAC